MFGHQYRKVNRHIRESKKIKYEKYQQIIINI